MIEIYYKEKVEDSIGNIGNDYYEIVQKTMFWKRYVLLHKLILMMHTGTE